MDLFYPKKMNSDFLSENILEYLIKKNPNKPWDWFWISRNPNITMEFIEKKIPINHGIGTGSQGIQILQWKLLKKIPINHGIGMGSQGIQILQWNLLRKI